VIEPDTVGKFLTSGGDALDLVYWSSTLKISCE